jgi:hypothetical protein
MNLKRKELVLGTEYVVFEKIKAVRKVPAVSNNGRASNGFPGSGCYIRGQLIDLRSGNRAVIQYDEPCWDKAMFSPVPKKVITRRVLKEISCSQILATAEDWDKHVKVFDIRARHLVLDRTQTIGPDSLAGQGDMETMDRLRRGEYVDPDATEPLPVPPPEPKGRLDVTDELVRLIQAGRLRITTREPFTVNGETLMKVELEEVSDASATGG